MRETKKALQGGQGNTINTHMNYTKSNNHNQTKKQEADTKMEIVKEDLKNSCLTIEDVEAIGWKLIETKEELKNILGFTSINNKDILQFTQAVLKIPYPGTNFSRVKLYPKIEDVKYLQPKNIAPQPYILPKIYEIKDKATKPLIFTEGEKKTLCAIKNGFNCIGLPGVWQFKNQKEHRPFLPKLEEFNYKNRVVHICFDSDAIYNTQVLKAEIELALNLYAKGAKVFIMRLPQNDHNQKVGLDDFIVENGKEEFVKLYNQAKPLEKAYGSEYKEEFLNRLADVYDMIDNFKRVSLEASLRRVWGIQKKDFYILLEEKLGRLSDNKDNKIVIENIEPFEQSVDGDELANTIEDILKKYVYLKEEEYIAITLWVFLSYMYENFNVLPILFITSPTRGCGKTTLLSVLEGLVNRSIATSNITPSAVFRVIEKYKPTLIMDEADTDYASVNEDLRGIVNAGHTKRTAFVIRTGDKAQNFEPQRFNVYSPKVIARIRKAHITWMDRSIIIKMEKKPTEIKLDKFNADTFFDEMRELRRKILRWSIDNSNLELVEPPNIGNDRAADNWTPLLSISKAISDKWYKKALNSMYKLQNIEVEDDKYVLLLSDIKAAFEEKGGKISSQELCDYLNELKESPWGDYNHGKGITVSQLAKMIRAFNIKSKNIRIGYDVLKGYELKQFEKVFSQYLPLSSRYNATMASEQEEQQDLKRYTNDTVADLNSEKMASKQECSVVAFQKGDTEKKVEKSNLQQTNNDNSPSAGTTSSLLDTDQQKQNPEPPQTLQDILDSEQEDDPDVMEI